MWLNKGVNTGTDAVLIGSLEGDIKLEQWKNTKKLGVTKYGVIDTTFDYVAPEGQWIFVSFVGDENGTTLYVNGENKGHVNVVISAPAKRIGASAKSELATSGNMVAQIDNLYINNNALTESEVKDLYYTSLTDKAALKKIIDEAKTLDQSLYLEESWSNLEKVLSDAEAIYQDAETTQDKVDAMIPSLQDAIAKLVLKEADYTKVDEAIKKANALNKDDYKDFSAVEKAIANVQRGLDITKQEEVDNYAKAIEEAISKLELKDEDSKDTDKEDTDKEETNKDQETAQDQNEATKTGDTTPIYTYVFMAGLSLLCVGYMIFKKKYCKD